MAADSQLLKLSRSVSQNANLLPSFKVILEGPAGQIPSNLRLPWGFKLSSTTGTPTSLCDDLSLGPPAKIPHLGVTGRSVVIIA